MDGGELTLSYTDMSFEYDMLRPECSVNGPRVLLIRALQM